jgi:hypothetical protein
MRIAIGRARPTVVIDCKLHIPRNRRPRNNENKQAHNQPAHWFPPVELFTGPPNLIAVSANLPANSYPAFLVDSRNLNAPYCALPLPWFDSLPLKV